MAPALATPTPRVAIGVACSAINAFNRICPLRARSPVLPSTVLFAMDEELVSMVSAPDADQSTLIPTLWCAATTATRTTTRVLLALHVLPGNGARRAATSAPPPSSTHPTHATQRVSAIL